MIRRRLPRDERRVQSTGGGGCQLAELKGRNQKCGGNKGTLASWARWCKARRVQPAIDWEGYSRVQGLDEQMEDCGWLVQSLAATRQLMEA